MRLTLRTMLAYLDDILEPDDADDIGKKIAESDFASSLVHRSRDCVRRMRLGAPALVGKGLAADPNSVAEYLDNTLQADRVPEFEKICLESDVHLAEVASCHQILTLVLGEPAEIDPASRQRMYEMIVRADEPVAPVRRSPEVVAPPLPHRTPTVSDTPEIQPVTARRQRPVVPDYLRESHKSRFWPIASYVSVAALVTLAILYFFGPASMRNKIAQFMTENEEQQQAADNGDRENPPVENVVPAVPAEDSTSKPDEPATVDPAPVTTDAEKDVAPPPDTSDFALPTPAVEGRGASGPAMPDQLPGIEDSGAPVAPVPGDLATSNPTELPGTPTEEPTKSGEEENPLRTAAPPVVDTGPTSGGEMGRFLSDGQVVLALNGERGWQRLPARAVINSGDHILIPPAFRPAISLTNSVAIQVIGPSLFDFVGFDANGVPVINVEYGRMGILTNGKAGNQVHLRLGDQHVLVTFGDAQSTLALEVVGVLVTGKDPEEGPAELAVDMYATSGEIHWTTDGSDNVLKAPEHVSLTPKSAAGLAPGQLPEWVIKDTTNSNDQQAALQLEKELTSDRPLSLTIKELAQHRRVEVRALAIRCSGYMGNFDAYINGLNDADQKVSWTAQIDSLRAALARGPEVAKQVRETLEQQRGPDAKLLYRMLWGYTEDQLKAGDDEVLVDALSNDSLDVRRLGFWNLRAITGKSLFYFPEHPAAKRKTQVKQWKEQLKEGKIVPVAATNGKAAAPRAGTESR